MGTLGLRFRVRGRRGILPIGMALVAGIIVCWGARPFRTSSPPLISSPKYLVARRDLPQGHALQFADLSFVSRGDWSGIPPKGIVTDQELSLLKGAELTKPMAEGEPLVFGSLQLRADTSAIGGKIPRGMRAYEVEVKQALSLHPTDLVDISQVPRRPGENPVLLVEGASVLSTERNGDTLAVMLALDPSEVGLVEKAVQTGKLELSLRNPDEERPLTRRRARHVSRGVPKFHHVEIWSEDFR